MIEDQKKRINFVNEVYKYAKEIEQEQDGISSLFVTAQAALESGWGKYAIGNNLFGITKGSSWKGKTQLVTTTEYFNDRNKKFKEPEEIISVLLMSEGRYKYKVKRLFRDYDSIKECLEDHLKILKKPIYADAWQYRKDPKEFARRISDDVGAKYATSPTYTKVMNALILQVKRMVNES